MQLVLTTGRNPVARCLFDLSDGAEIAEHVTPYRHHVIDEQLAGIAV